MDQGLQDLFPQGFGRIGQQVPEVGVERLVRGGADEAHPLAVGIVDTEMPGAAFQDPLPNGCCTGEFAAGAQQVVEIRTG